MQTVEINNKVYKLPPFNSGQLRRMVDPVLEETCALVKQIERMEDAEDNALELSAATRALQRKHGELVVVAMQNSYPRFCLEDLDELTQGEVTDLFNSILVATQGGAKSPGKGLAPTKAKKA